MFCRGVGYIPINTNRQLRLRVASFKGLMKNIFAELDPFQDNPHRILIPSRTIAAPAHEGFILHSIMVITPVMNSCTTTAPAFFAFNILYFIMPEMAIFFKQPAFNGIKIWTFCEPVGMMQQPG